MYMAHVDQNQPTIEKMHYYLVDLENVGLQGLCGLNLPRNDSEIRIFLSDAAHVGTAEVCHDVLESNAKIETTFCSCKGKNALDFQLSAYFGASLERKETRRISIISKDGGFRSLEDYAKKWRKDVAVYQGHSILEAFVASEKKLNPRMYEKGKPMDFKKIMEALRKKAFIEEPPRQKFEACFDDKTLGQIAEIITPGTVSKRKTYLECMKVFGKQRGTEIYRVIKDVMGL